MTTQRCRQQVVNHEMFLLSHAAFPFIIIFFFMTLNQYFYYFFLQNRIQLLIFKLWDSEHYNNTGFLLNPNRNVTQVGVFLPLSSHPPNIILSVVNQTVHITRMPAHVLHAEPTPDSHIVVSTAC